MTRPGYKMTEIGEIPEDWDAKKIKEIAKVKYGKSNPKTEGEVPLVGSSGVFGSVGKPLIHSPTIIIGRKGTAGAVWDIRTPSWPSDTSFYLEYKTEVSQKFLFEWMSLNKLKGENAKTTLPSVKREEIEELLFPLPPLQEQQKIAEILSSADESIQKVTEEITLTERLKKGLMQTLLTKGIGHTKFKMTEIGEIPAEWNIKKLGDVSEVIVPMRDKPKKFDGTIPWLRIEDLDGKYAIRSKSEQKVSETTIVQMKLKPYPIGTVLCSCSGKMGICAITREVLITNQTFAGIVTRAGLFNEYLYYLLSSFPERLQSIATGTTLSYLSREKIENLLISVPPIEEQQKIAEILSTVDDKLELLKNKREHLKKLKRGLMSGLLTGKVRVNAQTSKGDN